MGERKKHQPPMTIDEQVENLKRIGLIVDDEEYARRILNDISYFRLVKASTFKQIVDLYLLKKDTRWNMFVDNIEILFDKYESVQISTMGFPENWKDLLRNN